MKKYFVYPVVLILLIFTCVRAADLWKVQSDASYVSFTVRGIFGKVHGKVSNMQAEIRFSEDDLENSSFRASVGPGTINTDNKKRDKHLKSEDFFFVEKFPEIKFTSKKITKDDKGYKALGNLTIKDVTREVAIPFTFEKKDNSGIFKGKLAINRMDYHIYKKSKMVGEVVDVEIIAVVQK